MIRYAIASEFDDGTRYFTGAFDRTRREEGRRAPLSVHTPELAYAIGSNDPVASLRVAEALAAGLTDFCGVPHERRTWFVVELPARTRDEPITNTNPGTSHAAPQCAPVETGAGTCRARGPRPAFSSSREASDA